MIKILWTTFLPGIIFCLLFLYVGKQIQHSITGKRIIKLRNRSGIKDVPATPPYYQWRSENKLILLRVKEAQGGVGGAGGHYSVGTGFYAVELNARTGKESPFSKLNKRRFGKDYRAIGYWTLSSDGNWLLWPEAKRPQAVWHAAKLDGSQEMSWPIPTGEAVGFDTPYYAWTPDSRRWVGLVWRDKKRIDAVVGSLDTPGSVREIRNVHAVPGFMYAGSRLLGFLPNKRALAALYESGQDKQITLFSFEIEGRSPSTRDLTVRLPSGAHARDVALSPKGDRLAWVFLRPNAYNDELWVSQADGTQMHKVSQVSYRPLFPMEDEHHPEGLNWTLDGKHISFIHKNALHTIRIQ